MAQTNMLSAAALAALVPVASAALAPPAMTSMNYMASHMEACITESTEFSPFMNNVSHTMQTSVEKCQISCALTPGCAYFSYKKSLMQCNYAGPGAKAEPNWEYTSGRPICMAGEGAPAVKCRSERALNGFPGVNAEMSRLHFTFNRIPKSLECWPRDENGKLQKCKTTKPLEDTTTEKWPGTCWHMDKREGIPPDECNALCANDPECPAFVNNGEACYTGQGTNCYKKGKKPKIAQREMQGKVNVLMDMTGWQVFGLVKVFEPLADGYFKTDEEALKACKHTCYSDINCEYWNYNTQNGCWVESKSLGKKLYWANKPVPYPLTLDAATRDSSYAQKSIGGEYIQHYCEEAEDAEATVPSIPHCALSGWYMERLDKLTTDDKDKAVTVANAGLCQKMCFDVSKTQCSYFSWHVETGECHLAPNGAVLKYSKDYISGPQVCPKPTPGPQAACSLHPQCVKEQFTDLCCPNQDGIINDCCQQTAIQTAVHERASDFGDDVVEVQPKGWLYYWWPMLLASGVVLVAMLFSMWWFRRSGQKKRSLEPLEPQPQDVDPLIDPFSSDMDMSIASTANLPFPEAGLPNTHVPFPEAAPVDYVSNGSMSLGSAY